MNPLQRMELHKADFTQNDQIIYDCIMKNPAGITHMSTSSLAELCGVSQPALSRFVKGLGYARYQDFRAELIGMVAQQTEQAEQGQEHLLYFSQCRISKDKKCRSSCFWNGISLNLLTHGIRSQFSNTPPGYHSGSSLHSQAGHCS